MRLHRWQISLLFLLILGLYLLLSFYQLDLPGIHYDEAFEVVPAIQLLQGHPVFSFRNSGLTIGDQLYPIMTQDYIGAINTYASLPFVYCLGPTPSALRIPAIIIGAITLWLTFLLTHRLSKNPIIGLGTALLLAVDPTFVFWNRQGIFVTAVTATLGLGAVYCGLRRWEGGRLGWGLGAAFLLGLGLYAKLLFIWLIAALAGSIIVLNWRHLTPAALKIHITSLDFTRREFMLLPLAFLAGCWPLILYNIQTQGTILSITENAQISYYGVDNDAFAANLLERLHQFGVLLNGSHLWYLGNIYSNPSPVILFTILLGVLVYLLANLWCESSGRSLTAPRRARSETGQSVSHHKPTTRKISGDYKITLFPFLVIGFVILASIRTVSALWVTHFALLLPWPAIAIMLAVWGLSPSRCPVWSTIHLPNKTVTLALTLSILLVVGLNLTNTIRYHQSLTKSGGLSSHSDAVYDLSEWLAAHNQHQPTVVAMDWGLAAPIIYLTNGQVNPIEVFGYAWQSDQSLEARLGNHIKQPPTLYLWRAPDEVIFDRSAEFKALYQPKNLQETIEEAFYERSGRPLLGVTRLVPQGAASNPP